MRARSLIEALFKGKLLEFIDLGVPDNGYPDESLEKVIFPKEIVLTLKSMSDMPSGNAAKLASAKLKSVLIWCKTKFPKSYARAESEYIDALKEDMVDFDDGESESLPDTIYEVSISDAIELARENASIKNPEFLIPDGPILKLLIAHHVLTKGLPDAS